MIQKDRSSNNTVTTNTATKDKASVYNDDDFEHFDKKPETNNIPVKREPPKINYSEPDKQFRRNITLSEEQFRRLEFIKKSKNKTRAKEDDLVTLDKLMFDMVQHCLDTQYPETKSMFEKYLKIKQMEGFADLM